VHGAPILAARLRLGDGFGAEERGHLLEVLSALDRHLRRWPSEEITVQVSVSDRGGPEQKVTLEARLPGSPALLAAAAGPDLGRALIDVRRDLIRQIEGGRARRDNRLRQPGRPG